MADRVQARQTYTGNTIVHNSGTSPGFTNQEFKAELGNLQSAYFVEESGPISRMKP